MIESGKRLFFFSNGTPALKIKVEMGNAALSCSTGVCSQKIRQIQAASQRGLSGLMERLKGGLLKLGCAYSPRFLIQYLST